MKRFFLTLGIGLLSATGWTADGPITDTAFVVNAAKRSAILWDVRSATEYAHGHLPGAANIGDAAQVLRDANSEDFLSTDKIEKLLGEAGIDPSREIVVYGARGTWNPYFGRYAIRYFGGKQVYVYHGGIDDWRAAGHPVSVAATKLAPVALKLAVDASVSVSTAEVVASLKNEGVQIIDARTPGEYRGEDIRAIRGGHIPGAVNIPYEMNWVDPQTGAKLANKQVPDSSGMSLKPTDQLKALYASLDPSKETIVYCQSGARAAETAGVLEQLGFKKVKIYDSSWLGYGNSLDAPAKNVTFFNVGALNGKIAGLQARIAQLERELAEGRKKQ